MIVHSGSAWRQRSDHVANTVICSLAVYPFKISSLPVEHHIGSHIYALGNMIFFSVIEILVSLIFKEIFEVIIFP